MNDTTQFLTGFGGLAVFAAVFADQAGLPIPAPPLLLAAGALAAAGKLDPALAVGMTAAAAMLADSLWFCLGRKSGGRALPAAQSLGAFPQRFHCARKNRGRRAMVCGR